MIFSKTTRFKITILYMSILTLTLSVFSILLYHNFRRSYFESVDNLISSRAQGIAYAIDAYWEEERLETIKNGGVSGDVFSKVNNINFTRIAQRWIKEQSDDPRLMGILVWIFDAKGNYIVSSKNISPVAGFPRKTVSSLPDIKAGFRTLDLTLMDARTQSFRVYTLPVIENSRLAYIVQVANPLGGVYQALIKLKTILLILLPLTVFITGVVGVFLAGIALRPVDAMIKTIHQITAENLKLRITIPDTKDEIKHLADTFNDMLERLDKTFTSQQQFLQDISHELKTPLTIIRGEIEVILKKKRSPEEYERVLKSALEEINRVSRIFENLLVLARFDSKKISLELKSLDVNNVIKDILEDTEQIARQKNIKITFFPVSPAVFRADEYSIRRLVLNLLDNALKYTPAGGDIHISTSRGNNLVVITVSDTGPGISPEALPQIFDRFYRADASRRSDGFGLGLSIVKSIVQAHNGTIDVKSSPGRGTTFLVSFPV